MGISLNPSTLLSGQGIDVSSLVQQVLSESDGQLTEWQNEQTTLQTQASDITSINNDLNNLATAVQALSDPMGALTAQTATSSNDDVLTATTSSSAAAGTHQIVVSSLATAGTVYTDDFAGGADASILPNGASSGEIDLQIGGSGGTTQAIAISAGSNDTLNSLAQYINGENWGVTASVVTDANGSRLALVSQSTGTPAALAITGNNTNLSFDTPTGGTNASLTIDGIPYSSASNTISGAIPGITLNLGSADPGTPVELTVGTDPNQITQAVSNFVSAYNQVVNDINQQYTVDPTTNTEGPLGSDTALQSLQSSLFADAAFALPLTTSSGAVNNSGYVNLASIGITTNDDGTLTMVTTPTVTDGTVTQTSFAQALAANPTAVQNFFQNATETGFANNFNNDLNNQTNPTTGPLNSDLAQNAAEQQDLTTSINNFETQLTAEQQSLTTQFDQVNASLQAYPLLLQETTETLASLDAGSSSSSTSAIPTLSSGL